MSSNLDFPSPITILRGCHAGKLAWSRGPVASMRHEISKIYIRVKGEKQLVQIARDSVSDEIQGDLL